MRIFRITLAFVFGATSLNLLLAQFNNHILPLHLFCAGLFVAYSAFHLHPRAGFIGVFLIGLFMDARMPVAFGTQALLLAALHTCFHELRDRFDRNSNVARILAAILANLVFCAAVIFICSRNMPLRTVPIFASLCLSQILTGLITPWYFAAQDRLMRLIGPSSPDAHIHRTRSTWLTK